MGRDRHAEAILRFVAETLAANNYTGAVTIHVLHGRMKLVDVQNQRITLDSSPDQRVSLAP